MRYYLIKKHWDRKRELRQLKREEYNLKELRAKDANDPRVLLSQRQTIDLRPMSLSKAMAQETLNQFRRFEAETKDMEAQIEAGVKVDRDNPQPRPAEVERILREMSDLDEQ
jgi:hypothetical protein